MEILRITAAIVLFITSQTNVFAQGNQSTFWNQVETRYQNKTMASGMRAWVYEIAQKNTGSVSGALAALETLSTNRTLQDVICLTLYVNNYNNRESLRVMFASLCGNYSLGNPMADYVFTKYATDARAKKRIQEGLVKAREQEKKETDRKKKDEAETQRQHNELVEGQRKRMLEIAADKKNDSLIALAEVFEHMVDGGEITGWRFDQNPVLKWNRTYSERGVSRWGDHQEDFLKRPSTAESQRGSVVVSFTITESGEVDSAKVLVSLSPEYDNAALAVIEATSGNWKPAVLNKRKVPCSLMLSVYFE